MRWVNLFSHALLISTNNKNAETHRPRHITACRSASSPPSAGGELPTAEAIEAAPFMEAVGLASVVCEALQGEDEAAKASAEALIPSFLSCSDGARGWFVSTLSDPTFRAAALNPAVPRAILSSVPSSSDPDFSLPRLMIMNVIMPLATAMAHESAGNTEGAAASLETFDRASKVLTATAELGAPSNSAAAGMIKADLTAVAAAATIAEAGWEEGEGKDGKKKGANEDVENLKFWIEFMKKWGYQPTQKQALYAVSTNLLKSL